MHIRSTELTAFLNSLQRAIAERANTESDTFQVTEKIMSALEVEHPSTSSNHIWLPVCELLNETVKNVVINAAETNTDQPYSIIEHAQALLALSPQLTWWHRTDDVEPGSPWPQAMQMRLSFAGEALKSVMMCRWESV